MHFNTMDYDEQITHLHAFARQAAQFYGLKADLTLTAYTNNAVFRAGDVALRVHRPGHKPLNWIESEQVWLRFIHSLNVPEPLGGIYAGTLPGVDGAVYGTAYRWIEGTAREVDALTPDDLYHIGRLAAELHTHADGFTPPPGFERPRYDWNGLFSEGSPYHPGEGMRLFSERQLAVINDVTEQVRQAMTRQTQSFGMIHADLIAKNILFDGEAIGLVDFDDCAFGYYLYDLTPLLWLSRGTARYVTVKDALWTGYTDVRPGTDGSDLDTFVAARHVASMRWIAGNAEHPSLRGKAQTIINQRIDELLKSY